MASARQHSPANELEDFWKEFKDIESSKGQDGEEDDLAKTPDEGEQEAAWLQEAGYGFLVSKMEEDGKELSEEEIHALTSPLSNHHAVAVRKRVDTLNATLRKKQKYTTKIDVRNIFPQLNSTGTHQGHNDTQIHTDMTEKHTHTRQGLKLEITNPLTCSTPQIDFSPTHSTPNVLNKLTTYVPEQHGKHEVFQFKGFKLDEIAKKHQSDLKRPRELACKVDPSHADTVSLGLSSESPLSSPCHSKSSSCDTLDSLDSGLDSSFSNLTGSMESNLTGSRDSNLTGSRESNLTGSRESNLTGSRESNLTGSRESNLTGSHDSIDGLCRLTVKPNFYETENQDSGISHSNKDANYEAIGSLSRPSEIPISSSAAPLSPLVSPHLDTDDEESSPTLIWFRRTEALPEVSPRSPTTNKYVNNIYIETPRSPSSPSSPGSDSGHTDLSNSRRSSGVKGREKSFLRRGGYSMTGQTEEVQDNAEMGVEMLSVQTRHNHTRHDSDSYKRSSQLTPISDTDIVFDFNVEEDKTDRTEIKPTIKPLHKDDLPNYSLVYDPLGNTHIDDVTTADMGYIKSVALLELTSMLDTHCILYTRRRSKRKHKDQGVFGVPLSTLLENDQKKKSNTKVPLVFTEIISYLVKHCIDSEGLLRVPGLVSRVQQLRQEFEDRFYQGTFTWSDDLTPNDVAALLKQFLRELPSPLLTDEYIEAFAQVENLPDRKLQLHALNLLILLLPDVHRNTLDLLLEFLEQVVTHSNLNRMNLSNVAMIMAPNLFLAPKVRPLQAGKSKGNWDLQVNIATGTSNIIRMLIKYRKILWTVPSNILSHVRRQYELEQIRRNKDKSKTRFYNKRDKTDVYKKPALVHEADFQEGVIRIQAPNLTKSSTAIQLDDKTTAGDIVSKFKVIQGSQTWDSRKSAQVHKTSLHISSNPVKFTSAGDHTYLFEVGGNIGERCLPHNTNMLALYKVNPNAEWIIKQKYS